MNNIKTQFLDIKIVFDSKPIKQITDDFLTWISEYYNNTPYVYELMNESHNAAVTSKNKNKRSKRSKRKSKNSGPSAANNTASAVNNTASAANAASAVNNNLSTKKTLNSRLSQLSKSSIRKPLYSNIVRNGTPLALETLKSKKKNEPVKMKFSFNNPFSDELFRDNNLITTTLFVIRYSLYLIENNVVNNNKYILSFNTTKYNMILEFLNKNEIFRKELEKLHSANAYNLPIDYKYLLYDKFLKSSINAFNNADDFLSLGGTTYIIDLHGEPSNDTLLFKVPQNIKIGMSAPLNTFGLSNDIIEYHNYLLSKDHDFNNIIKYGPNYYQNINNNALYKFLNMNMYHENQYIVNIDISFLCKLIIIPNTDKDIDSNYYYKYYDDITKSTSLIHYMYNIIVKNILLKTIKPKPESDKTLYIRIDNIHNSFNIMIITNSILYDKNNLNLLRELFTVNGMNINPNTEKLYKEIEILANLNLKLFKSLILNKTNIYKQNISDIDKQVLAGYNFIGYNFIFKEELSYFITLIDNLFKNNNDNKPTGNLYLFSSCRYYSDIDNKNNKYNISKQLALSYLVNSSNKYISSLLKAPHTPNHNNLPYYNSLATHSTLNNSILKKSKDDKYSILSKYNSMYYNLVYDISKDFMILLTISRLLNICNNIILILNQKNTIEDNDNVEHVFNINIILYNLFIKPRKLLNPEDKHTIINTINNFKKTMYKTQKYNKQEIKTIHNYIRTIIKYINKYYKNYLTWIKNNFIFLINYNKNFSDDKTKNIYYTQSINILTLTYINKLIINPTYLSDK